MLNNHYFPLFSGMVLASLLVTGCSSRASQDMVTYNSLTQEDRNFVESQRNRTDTGGTTSLKKTPRWVYMNGALVDTNNAQWLWEEASPGAPEVK